MELLLLSVCIKSPGPINQGLMFLGLITETVSLFHNLIGAAIGEVYLLLPYPVLLL